MVMIREIGQGHSPLQIQLHTNLVLAFPWVWGLRLRMYLVQGVSSSSSFYRYPEGSGTFTTPWDGQSHWNHPLSRDFTTQTVSTAEADINCDDLDHPDFVTFDLDSVPPLRTPLRERPLVLDVAGVRRTTPV